MREFPHWKIARELRRIGRNSKEAATELVRKLYFRRHYDLVTRKNIKRTFGAVPLGKDVAIYLIYPRTGMLQSHQCMLDEMRRAGISPIVVSNLPLSNDDRHRICQNASVIIERPNVGYDFGGYRDGILEMSENLQALDRIWLLNDSAWLIQQQSSWFYQARMMGKDFVGATSSFSILRKTLFGAKRWNASDYRSIEWTYEPRNPNFHYASYALCIGSAILRDRRFLRYWEKLDIRNDKKRTVRRGEIGLSQWVLKSGYTHGATHEINRLDSELSGLSAGSLDAAARELVIFRKTKLVEIKKRVLATDPNSKEGRDERVALILTAVARQGSAYALALYNLRLHDFQFLKKSPLWLSADGPDALLKFTDTFDDQKGAHIAEEARVLCADRASKQNTD